MNSNIVEIRPTRTRFVRSTTASRFSIGSSGPSCFASALLVVRHDRRHRLVDPRPLRCVGQGPRHDQDRPRDRLHLARIEKARFVRGSVIPGVHARRQADRQDAAFEERTGVAARIEELAAVAVVLAVEAQVQVAPVRPTPAARRRWR